MKKRVEILAPAGSFESMKAAVAAGADAVYIGGSRFGARAFANNLDEERMLEAIDYAHFHGCRLYMTVNTLVKERELSELYAYLAPYYERGLDAVIVQDMGVFTAVREKFPDLPVHASTQMTITGPLGAKLMMDMGASRIVTARELSLEEIREIHESTGAEIESFVHGALCYCYSGQCLFSSLIGGRSGNRGRCAQTCRLPFEVKRGGKTLNQKDERYVLSLKDLCTLDILPELIEAGIYSMKIEGRMKSPRYTAGVVSIYRKYADLYLANGKKGYRVDPKDRRMLLDLFDRGGQTEGYYKEHNNRDMVVLKEKPAFRQENRELYDYLDKTYVDAVLKKPVAGSVWALEGKPLRLKLQCGDIGIEMDGSAVQTAQNQPMTAEKIEKQIAKTGNTPFYFEKLTTNIEGSPFVPIQELNELRRNGFCMLEEAILAPQRRSVSQAKHGEEEPLNHKGRLGDSVWSDNQIQAHDKTETSFVLNVSLEQPESLETVLNEEHVTGIYIDSATFDAAQWKITTEQCHKRGKSCFLSLPHIYRDKAADYFKQQRQNFLQAGFDGVLVRAWEEIELMNLWAPDMPMVFDYGIYAMNKKAESMIRSMATGHKLRFTLPVELNSKELEGLGCGDKELIVYGHIPVMVTAQCMRRTLEACTRQPETLLMRDRMGKDFPVKNMCRFCYNTVYNCSPLSLLQDRSMIERLEPSHLRLNFTIEGRERIQTVIRAFTQVFFYGEEAQLSGDFTRGHFKRGIE